MDEVPCPHMIHPGCPRGKTGRTVPRPFPLRPPGYLEPFFTPKAPDILAVHPEAFRTKQNMDTPGTALRVPSRQFIEMSPDRMAFCSQPHHLFAFSSLQ